MSDKMKTNIVDNVTYSYFFLFYRGVICTQNTYKFNVYKNFLNPFITM